MRIGIDIKALRNHKAGIGRYITCLLNALQEQDLENEYVLFSPQEVAYEIKNSRWKKVVCQGRIKLPGILWQQITLPLALKKENLDLFWGPEQTLFLRPILGLKKVITIYDFVYKRYPQTMEKSVLWILNYFGTKSLLCSDQLVCISNFTAKEMNHFYPSIPLSKIGIVPCGFFTKEESYTPITREPFLLFVGSLEPRKNFVRLIKALEILNKKGIDIPLYLTGPSGWKNQDINQLLKSSPIQKNTTHLGYVSNEELKDLYQRCKALIFPSLYEGFGLPVLEALALKTPVLTSKDSVMEEIAGPCAIYFDSSSEKSIANTIESFWFSKTLTTFTKEQEEARIKILEKYTWENAASAMLSQFSLSKRAES